MPYLNKFYGMLFDVSSRYSSDITRQSRPVLYGLGNQQYFTTTAIVGILASKAAMLLIVVPPDNGQRSTWNLRPRAA